MAARVLVSRAEYARLRGVQKSTVLRAIDSGRITTVEQNGQIMIDPEVADIQWAKNTQEKFVTSGPTKDGAAISTVPTAAVQVPREIDLPGGYDRALATAKRETHEANLAQMREAKEAGALLERSRVIKAATDSGALVRTVLERLPNLADELFALGSAAAIRARLHGVVSEVLVDLADNLRLMAGAADDDAPGDRNGGV